MLLPPLLGRDAVRRLTRTAAGVAKACKQAPDPRQAYVGSSAFAHKGGLHVSAVAKDAAAYEHVDPAAVGNAQRVLVSELSGRANIWSSLQKAGLVDDGSLPDDGSPEAVARALAARYDAPLIYPGALLRAAAYDSPTPLGVEAKRYLDSTRVVPDDLVVKLVLERVQREDCRRRGWVLDLSLIHISEPTRPY